MGQSRSSFEGSCERLAAELQARKDDPAFWGPVAGLLQEIPASARDRQGRGQLPEQARLLATWDVEALARRLRDALPMASEKATAAELAAQSGSAGALSGTFSPSALASFLLLGFALSACDPGPQDDSHESQFTGTGGQTTSAGSRTGLSGTFPDVSRMGNVLAE